MTVGGLATAWAMIECAIETEPLGPSALVSVEVKARYREPGTIPEPMLHPCCMEFSGPPSKPREAALFCDTNLQQNSTGVLTTMSEISI